MADLFVAPELGVARFPDEVRSGKGPKPKLHRGSGIPHSYL